MMATPNEISYLKAQLVEVERLLQLVAHHPLMSQALTCRESELREQIRQTDVSFSVNLKLPSCLAPNQSS